MNQINDRFQPCVGKRVPSVSGLSLNRKVRLTRSSEIKRVRRDGKSYVHPLIVLMACRNDQDTIRIGIIAGKRVGGAVQRNRAKRLMREAVRPWIPRLSPGWDLLFLARTPISGSAYDDVQNAVSSLLSRVGIILEADAS